MKTLHIMFISVQTSSSYPYMLCVLIIKQKRTITVNYMTEKGTFGIRL